MSDRPDTASLPARIDGARRDALLGWDDWSTTWSGWDTSTGRPLRLRLLRPAIAASADAGRHLRVPAPVPGVLWPTAHRDGVWPHLRLALPGPPLQAVLPLDEPLDPLLSAQVLGAAAAGVQALHRAQHAPSGPLAAWLFFDGGGVRLGWAGPGETERPMSALATLAATLEPITLDPLCALVQGWASLPPPDPDSAAELVRRALHDQLAAATLTLHRRRGSAHARGHRARLARAIERLAAAVPPPRLDLHLDTVAGPLAIGSDGRAVTAGPPGAPGPVYAPRGGLRPATARLVLRAWAAAGHPSEAAPLMRWLRGMSRLRVARLLVSPRSPR